MLSITPIQGNMGESLGAVRELPALNRKQMMLLLPSLLTGRKATAKAKGTIHSVVSATSLNLKATGTDQDGIQILMGEIAHHSDSPKILGKSILHLDVPDVDDYTPVEKLRLEQAILGFAISHNEMALHKGIAETQGAIPSHKLARYAGQEVTVAGTASAGRRHMSKAGEWMLFLTLQDYEGLIEVVLFPDTYKKSVEILANGGYGPYLITGQVQVSGKGRGIGIQPPANLRPTDAVYMKMHPIIIANDVKMLE